MLVDNHPGILAKDNPNAWWGCSEPERPYDTNMELDARCSKCLLKGQMVLQIEGDIIAAGVNEQGIAYRKMALQRWVEVHSAQA